MKRWYGLLTLALVGALVVDAGTARAERTPSMRTSGMRSTGARRDITVPYLTTGYSAFMPYSVAPRIYASPIVDDPRYPQVKPVYNLQFYGAQQAFGDRSNGATPKPK